MIKWLVALSFLVPSLALAIPRECHVVLSPYDGAKRGFLWKQSEDYPGAVCLMPPKYSIRNRFRHVSVITSRSKTLDVLRFYYVYTEEAAKNRDVWRANKRADTFPRNIYVRGVRGTGKNTRKVCWRLRNPSERID